MRVQRNLLSFSVWMSRFFSARRGGFFEVKTDLPRVCLRIPGVLNQEVEGFRLTFFFDMPIPSMHIVYLPATSPRLRKPPRQDASSHGGMRR